MRRLGLVAVFVLAALLLSGCGSEDDGDEGGDSAGGASVELVATEFAFEPTDVSIDEAGETTFTVTNEGEFPHALELEGNGIEEGTEELAPGESASLTVDLEPGEYVLYCPVGDHRDQGMEGTLVVGGASASGSGGADRDDDDGYGYG